MGAWDGQGIARITVSDSRRDGCEEEERQDAGDAEERLTGGAATSEGGRAERAERVSGAGLSAWREAWAGGERGRPRLLAGPS